APVPAETAVVTLPPRRGSRLYGAVGLVVLAAIVIAAVFIIRGANQPQQETPIPAVAAADTATATPTPQPTATSTQTPRAPETAAPGETPDVVASAVAAIELTREAQPTSTGTPTRTPSPTPTITPDATAAFLNNCTVSVELVDAYTYQNRSFSSAPIDSRFPANWILRNSGTCSLAADLTWRYVDGETFGYTGGPIPLGQAVPEGEEVTLTATFVAPDAPGSYDSTWQLFDPADNPVGAPLTFSFGAYLPVTATPTAPPVPPTPVATATPEVEITELNYAFEFGACEYVGADWRCLVRLTPYGGGGGPYTLFVYDQPAGQATEFRGPWPANYFAQARRCSAFNSEIRVIDDATGTGFSRHLYVDPDVQFPGGCTLP
ncbi:MAG: hypothetical protein KC425_08805, partial [Anaerolineales bacterium]|nr:hypothetical protein [Anaerolineales bacterium]